jgi:TonB family protein
MVKIVRPFLFLVFVMLMSKTSLAISISRIGTFGSLNSTKENLEKEYLILDLPDDSILAHSEIEPAFPGGNQALTFWLLSNLHYPQTAIDKADQGMVYVQFTVDSLGKIQDIRIRKGVSEALDQEAIRLVSLMPNWIPGSVNGKPANIAMTIPIRFELG